MNELADTLMQLTREAPVYVPPAPVPFETAEKASDKRTQPSASADDIIILPSNAGVGITAAAEKIYQRMAPSHEYFSRGGIVVSLESDNPGELHLEVVTPEAFCSRIEKFGRPHAYRADDKGQPVLKSTLCNIDMSRRLLACEKVSLLPPVCGLSGCPVITETGGNIRVLSRGYHDECGGLLVTKGEPPPALVLDEAVEALRTLVAEFDFPTPGDRSRALAALITPALRMGGLLSGRIPIDVAEANDSQAGKGYRQQTIFAIYNEQPAVIARKEGGVGSIDESVSQALIRGRPFIQLNNLRGKLDSEFVESVMTTDGLVGARVPHHGEVRVDSRHFMFFITSNGVETTRDLAKRASFVRILKREHFSYRQFDEGDLLDHVRAQQPYFLGAVFSIIRAWIEKGKTSTLTTNHDFREWAGTLDWIVQNVLREAPLLDGHENAQVRVSNPALTWLRYVSLAMANDGRLGEEISAGAIAELCMEHEIALPGLRNEEDETRRKHVGTLLKRAFGSKDSITVDSIQVTRRTGEKYDEKEQRNRLVKTYLFEAVEKTDPSTTAATA